jgi:hypothetical protein
MPIKIGFVDTDGVLWFGKMEEDAFFTYIRQRLIATIAQLLITKQYTDKTICRMVDIADYPEEEQQQLFVEARALLQTQKTRKQEQE